LGLNLNSIIKRFWNYAYRAKRQPLYLFLDEGGNLDFSSRGTKHFILTSITKPRAIKLHAPLTEFKYDLLERGINIEYFHASEDNKTVRDRVFEIIKSNLKGWRVDSVIVDKQTVEIAWRKETRFYPRLLALLIRRVLQDFDLSQFSRVIIITDQIPLTHRRQAVAKSIKITLKDLLPPDIHYGVFHHDSKSNFDLQIVDYCSWAIYRKWERRDGHFYQMIQPTIESESETKLE
jgi:hypothetical protein